LTVDCYVRFTPQKRTWIENSGMSALGREGYLDGEFVQIYAYVIS
jgi:hypothetical protein